MNKKLSQLTFRIEKLSEEVMFDFLKKVDHLFIPELSSILNMKDYVHKLSEKAILFTVYDGDELISLLACYLNDQKSGIGYITLLVTVEKYQRHGIACKLIVDAVNYGKVNNYKEIKLEADKHQLAFYKKRGFSVMEKKLNSYMMSNMGSLHYPHCKLA